MIKEVFSPPAEFIPALSISPLTRFFDPVIRFILPELKLKKILVELAAPSPGQKVLDLGCGTGTLAILLKKTVETAEIIGIDIDENILKIAREKIDKTGLDIGLRRADSTGMPFTRETFDLVLSSLVTHHLTPEQKLAAFREVYRVLKCDGSFHILDLGLPHNVLMFLISLVIRNFEQTRDNIQGKLPEYLSEAGFKKVEIKASFSTLLGTISIISAAKS